MFGFRLLKFHYCLFKILKKNQNVVDKELQRAITKTKLAPSPYFSITNVHLVDINVFAKFYEIPSLPFQEKLKKVADGRQNGRMYVKTVYKKITIMTLNIWTDLHATSVFVISSLYVEHITVW